MESVVSVGSVRDLVAAAWARVCKLDPRWYQIGCLSFLTIFGFFSLGFDLTVLQATVTIVTALVVQYACTKLWRLPFYDPKSALISGVGLCIILRTNHLEIAALCAFIAIASKFVIRYKGKHIFNPTNGALVFLLAVGAPMWISPGQFGNVALFAFLMACLGSFVVLRSARADISIAFIAFWCLGLFGRSLWLGEPLTIPLHRLESGQLLLFTFHMISDPKTTPDSRIGRIFFAGIVAFGAWWITFVWFRTNGVLWSLAFFSMFVPLIDRIVKGVRYDWNSPTSGRRPPPLAAAESPS